MIHAPPVTMPDWKAPTGDGDVLLWPHATDLLRSTLVNHERLDATDAVRIQNLSLSELRRHARRWIGHHDHQRPLVAMGHQIELYHPGVFAKNVLVHEAAQRLGGAAYHFVIDTDAPKHLHLRWPGGAIPVTDDPAVSSAGWAGLVEAPTPAHLADLTTAFGRASAQWGYAPLVPHFLDALRRLSLESSGLTAALTNAIHQVEWGLGLRHHALLASPLWSSPPYLAFVHHLLAHADEFAAIYNATLGAYRREEGIRNSGRPWPDLHVAADEVEAPFWLDHLDTGARERARVRRHNGVFILQAPGGGADFPFDPTADGWLAAERLARFAAAHRLRLSPRALTLTAFLRLFLADQFVHGIGGARYDAVTNRVIHAWLGLVPPAYAVTTATLLFPPAAGRTPTDLRPLEREGRSLRHGDAFPEKIDFVRRIESLPRHSPERSRLFHQMHSMLENLAGGDARRQWERRYADARAAAQAEQGTFDRELFFALQSEDRLKMLMERYHLLLEPASGP